MTSVWEIAVLLVLIGAIALVAAPWIMRRGPRGEPAEGTLLVYQRMAVDVDHWPTMGELFPVVYSPRIPDNWTFAPPETPPTGQA
jgi:hypothetical protein